MASNLDTHDVGTTRADNHFHVSHTIVGPTARTPGDRGLLRIDSAHRSMPELPRFPERLSREEFYCAAYSVMVYSRRMEQRLLDLYRKGYVKGTVTSSAGNEATAVGMAMPFRPGRDVVSLLHRDFASHLLWGATPKDLLCQYLANADSPTHGREGNAHHGDAKMRRFSMISHLGRMLSLVVGGTWAARKRGEDAFGLTVVGDGGSSTGEFHESLNVASVHNVPVVFLVQNNRYSFSTPTADQYNCKHLSDRAVGYGIAGRTIDGLDPWTVYSAVCDALDAMRNEPAPAIIECMTLRLQGHAAYDKADYIRPEILQQWQQRDPLPVTRRTLRDEFEVPESELAEVEDAIDEQINRVVTESLKVARPKPETHGWSVYADSSPAAVKPVKIARAKNGEAVNRALDFILANNPEAFLAGLDVGTYGSAFKTCKGLIDRYGRGRVIDMPICEPATVGFALGASQVGTRPIIEFQFADFSTEAVTQLGLNAGTWYFRTGSPAPILLRLPCGGGLTMGPFHSGEFEGLWSRFPGLKLLYPATPQETFEALLAGFYDNNPCLVFEHKLLYWSTAGEIDFDGNLDAVWRPRRYTEGSELTLVALGAMVHEAIAAAAESDRSIEVWNPFVLQPLKLAPIIASVRKTGRLMVVQECGATQGMGDTIISSIVRQQGNALQCLPKLLAAPDVPVPFAPELESHYRPSAEKILAGVTEMFGDS